MSNEVILGRIGVESLEDQTYLTVELAADDIPTDYTVLPDEVFVMGDNRGFSEDSRSWARGRAGGVPIASIEGRVRRVLLGRTVDGRINASRLFSKLNLSLPFNHIDTKALEAGIEQCLKRAANQVAVKTI